MRSAANLPEKIEHMLMDFRSMHSANLLFSLCPEPLPQPHPIDFLNPLPLFIPLVDQKQMDIVHVKAPGYKSFVIESVLVLCRAQFIQICGVSKKGREEI